MEELAPMSTATSPTSSTGKLSDGVLGFSVANVLVRLCEGPNPSYKTRYAVWHDWRLSRLCPTAESLANTADAFKDSPDSSTFIATGFARGYGKDNDDFKPPRRKPHHPIPTSSWWTAQKQTNRRMEGRVRGRSIWRYGRCIPDIDERVRAYSKLAQAARLICGIQVRRYAFPWA